MSLVITATGTALAGDMTVRWDPVVDEDLTGYRLYVGDGSRSYGQVFDLAPAETGHTITDLEDCKSWFVALTSVDREGLESAYSEELSGFPQPRITSLSPDVLLVGSSGRIQVTGAAFEQGLSLSAGNLQVRSLSRSSCNMLVADLAAPVDSVPATVALQVLNPGAVPAVAPASLLLVTDPGPSIISVQPRDGTRDVPVQAAPVIEFDRDLGAASVTPDSVRLLDATGAPVAQSAGSPEVAGRTVAIRPAMELSQARTYRIQILGGTTGIRDAGGAPMVSHFLQAGGFTIIDLPPGNVPGVRRQDTAPPS